MATGGAFPTCDECGNLICLDDRGHKLDCSQRPDRPVRVTAQKETPGDGRGLLGPDWTGGLDPVEWVRLQRDSSNERGRDDANE